MYPNAPPGLMFPGDPGMPGGNKIAKNQWWDFSPRISAVWDPAGDGRQTIRGSYGHLYDMPHLQTYSSLPQMAPFGAEWEPRRQGDPKGHRGRVAHRTKEERRTAD